MEWARTNAHRGFITSWPQWGGPAGLFFANLAVLAFSAISGDQFLTWGWRVPFWLSIVMVGVGLYIRLGILETPVFPRILEERRIERTPVIEVIKRQPKQIILTALAAWRSKAHFMSMPPLSSSTEQRSPDASRDFLFDRCFGRNRAVWHHHSAGRAHFGPYRSQADVLDRRGYDRGVRASSISR